MPRPHPDTIIAALWRPRGDGTLPQIYAILDGARDERIHPMVMNADVECCCLYRGALHPELAHAAPYLLGLRPDAAFTSWLLTHGWGDSWGIFAESDAELRILRRHFRTFLMVYDGEGKPLYFRYYDPRVLRVYLPTCDAVELTTIFGPVNGYMAENEAGEGLLRYVRSGNELAVRAQFLTAPAA
jgi:hypothetical protein